MTRFLQPKSLPNLYRAEAYLLPLRKGLGSGQGRGTARLFQAQETAFPLKAHEWLMNKDESSVVRHYLKTDVSCSSPAGV